MSTPYSSGRQLQADIRLNIVVSSLPYAEVEAALGRLAYAMIEEGRLLAVTRKWAAEQLGNVKTLDSKPLDALLEDCKRAALLELSGDAISFADVHLLHYFAAMRLQELGLKGRITPAKFDSINHKSLFGYHSGKWDGAVVLLTEVVPDASQYLEEIAAINPFLAAICIFNGAEKSVEAYQYVKSRLWGIVRERKSVERRQAMAALHLIGDNSDLATFQNVLNTDRDFDVRITAAYAVAEFGGTAAIPTLLETFSRITEADVLDSGTVRHQMCWAIASRGEQAVLPLLEALLNETDSLKRFDLLVGLMKIANPEAKPSADLLIALGKADALHNGYAADTLIATLESMTTPEALHRFRAWRKKKTS